MVVAVDPARALVLGVHRRINVTGSVSIVVALVALSCSRRPKSSPTTRRRRCFRCSCGVRTSPRQRPDPGRPRHRQPACRPTARRRVVRRRDGVALRRSGVLVATGAILMSRIALPAPAGPDARSPGSTMRSRGRSVGPPPRRGPDPGADHLHLQHHVRCGVVRARALCVRAARPRTGRVRSHHHRLGVGGLVGTVSYGWITRRVSLGNIMRIGLIIETLTHLGPCANHGAGGRHADLLRLRCPCVHLGDDLGHGAPTGRPERAPGSGGQRQHGRDVRRPGRRLGARRALAQRFGVTAPFWFAFAGSAVFLVLIWGQLAHIAHDDAPPQMSGSAAGEPGRT